MWSNIVMQKKDIINRQDSVSIDNHLFGPMKEDLRGKHYASDEKVNTAVIKDCQQNFMWQGYMCSFKGRTLLLREAVTMLRSRDVIH